MNKTNFLQSFPLGYVYHKIIVDTAGKPIDYRFIEVNPAFEKITGLKADDIIGKTAKEVIADVDKVNFNPIELLENITMSKGGVTILERYSKKLDKWFKIQAYSDKKGFFTTIFSDITQAKRAENALKDHEKRLIAAQRIAKVGDFTWDVETGEVTFSDELYDLLGYDKSEKFNYSRINTEIHHPDDLERITKWFNNCIKSDCNELKPNEYRLIRKDGTIILVFTVGIIERNMGKIRIFATLQDITNRSKVLDEIKSARLLLDTVFDMSPFAMWISDRKGTVIRTNPSLREIINLTDDKIVGKYNVLKDVNLEKMGVMHMVQSVFENHHSIRFSIPWKAVDAGDVEFSDARDLFIDVSMFPILDADGELTNVVCQWVDITDHKLVELELRAQKERQSHILEGTNAGTWEWNVHTGETIFNERWTEIIGYKLEELSPLSIETWRRYVHPDDLEAIDETLRKHFNRELDYYDHEYRLKHKDGYWIWVQDRGKVISWTEDDKPLWMFGTHLEITERKHAEIIQTTVYQIAESAHTAKTLKELYHSIHKLVGVLMTAKNFYISMHDPSSDMLHFPYFVDEHNPTPTPIKTTDELTGYVFRSGESYIFTPNNSIQIDAMRETTEIGTRAVSWLGVPLKVEKWSIGVLVVQSYDKKIQYGEKEKNILEYVSGQIAAVIQRKRSEAEKEELYTQLNHAQKMESIGRLAGGVAHDFNNKLTVIMGLAEKAKKNVMKSDPLYKDLQIILKAGEQSAEIVRQLLAFARKQIVAPKVLNLNLTVNSMIRMLGRVIGEDIDLVWKPGLNLAPVKMDPSQIDQILANLCVNARDAIDTSVGRVTIETASVIFDEDYCAKHVGFFPGDFIMLAVSDNGSGMDKRILSNIFDPFFTTKSEGKGTGLGLSTVYGIVKQNKGFINVYSETERGTIFRIYLPVYKGTKIEEAIAREDTEPPMGEETIIIVEDEPVILNMTAKILKELGYTVLTAASPKKALHLAAAYEEKIHLLITDVIMPEMTGSELSVKMNAIFPDIKNLFMSGYTSNVIVHQGVLEEGVHFIQKPFTLKDLAIKVRQAIESNK